MAEDSPLKPIRFGVIGCAQIARKLIRSINMAPRATLRAIGSRSIEKAQKFAALCGLSETEVKIYGSYDQVLDDPCVDAVYVPLPTSLHLQWAVLAANKKKHLLLEKPTALDVVELDQILEACQLNGVQFMDGSMWLHHPRTSRMKELISDTKLIGQINLIYSTSTSVMPQEFFESNIRVKPDLDALGVVGDLGWYCIGAILWAKDYKLPSLVTALPDTTKNPEGVTLTCTASFHWEEDNTVATFYCSFVSESSMDLAVSGPKGKLHLVDLAIPFQEDSASFEFISGAKFSELHLGWTGKPVEHRVDCKLPQEVLMVEELAEIVEGIRDNGNSPNGKWPEISRKTQLVLDAVVKSIHLGFKPVNVNL